MLWDLDNALDMAIAVAMDTRWGDLNTEELEETAKKDPLYKFLSPGPFQWLYRGIVSGMTPSPELRGGGAFQPSSGSTVSAEKEMAASR